MNDRSNTITFFPDPGPALGPLTRPFACTLQPTDEGYSKVAKDLVRAGIFHKSAAMNFFATRNAALLSWCVFVAVALALGFVSLITPKLIAAALGIGILIYGLPRVILSSRAAARTKRIEHDLPDALDMLTMVMSGGLTIQQALDRVVHELKRSHPDLATEMAIIHRQSDNGSFDQAMRSFAARMDVPQITALTSMMRHNNRIGGKAVDAIREFADDVRRKRQIQAEEQGNKASVKLLMPVVFCLAPPIYIMLLGPALLELRNFVSRENAPGGVLRPSVEAAAAPGVRGSANDLPNNLSAAEDVRLPGDRASTIQRMADQFEASRR